MKVDLRPEDEHIISAKMRSGRYENPAEVVSAALDLFRLVPQSTDELRQAIGDGLASGPSTPLTRDDLDQALERGIERARRHDRG